MLTDTLYRVPRGNGLQLIQKRGDANASEITTWRLRLLPGESHWYCSADEETILVLQEGSGTLSAGGREWRVSRQSVFSERATALYLPPGIELHIAAGNSFEAVLVSAQAEGGGGEPVLAGPEEVQVNHRGRKTYTREVHDIFVRDPHARRLMVGETFTPPGHWSSFPPHKHDGRNGEPKLEEVYYYRVDPPQGFGHQVLYTNDGESTTLQVRDGDAVVVPYGYHPASAMPGHRLYYLWAMAGERRQMAMYEDPAYQWLHKADEGPET
jgi:5-deoxy-glucuronate isomerase